MYGPGFSIFLHLRMYLTQHTAYGLVRVLAASRRERAESKIPRSRKWEQLRMSERDDIRRALRMRHAPRRRVVVGRHVKSITAQELCSRACLQLLKDNVGVCRGWGWLQNCLLLGPCASSAAVSRPRSF